LCQPHITGGIKIGCKVNGGRSASTRLQRIPAANRAAGHYVVLENTPYVPDSVPGTRIFRTERPDGMSILLIFDLAP
jgi:hypothetical protein